MTGASIPLFKLVIAFEDFDRSAQAGARTLCGGLHNLCPALPELDRGMSFWKLHLACKSRPSPGTQGPGHQLTSALLLLLLLDNFDSNKDSTQ